MLIHLPGVLSKEQVARMREALLAPAAPWVDGLATAGHQGARVKDNRQLNEASPLARELGDAILEALERHPRFISAALPLRVYPPMFNRYAGGGHFGAHVDNSLRLVPGTSMRFRTDVSATLFLAEPEEYDGGELQIEEVYGTQSVKLPAGDMVLYPSTSLHQVTPVTRGERLASFFWIQSMVRDDAKRSLLFDMDMSIQQLGAQNPEDMALVRLTGCYHNLLRMWGET